MKNYLITGLKLTFITLLFFGILYPLVITGIAKLTAPGGGEGKILSVSGKTIGFEEIGQSFKSDRYFNSRPSAVNYNAASTGGSNKGPGNPEYLAEVEDRIEVFLKNNPEVKREDVTVDLITASGGGLDPHISPKAAYIQIPRIAKTRGIDAIRLQQLVKESIEDPLLGLFGTQRVNVLKLNLAVDTLN